MASRIATTSQKAPRTRPTQRTAAPTPQVAARTVATSQLAPRVSSEAQRCRMVRTEMDKDTRSQLFNLDSLKKDSLEKGRQYKAMQQYLRVQYKYNSLEARVNSGYSSAHCTSQLSSAEDDLAKCVVPLKAEQLTRTVAHWRAKRSSAQNREAAMERALPEWEKAEKDWAAAIEEFPNLASQLPESGLASDLVPPAAFDNIGYSREKQFLLAKLRASSDARTKGMETEFVATMEEEHKEQERAKVTQSFAAEQSEDFPALARSNMGTQAPAAKHRRSYQKRSSDSSAASSASSPSIQEAKVDVIKNKMDQMRRQLASLEQELENAGGAAMAA